MASALIPQIDTQQDSSVVPYARFLERQAWRAKIARDFRALDTAAVPASDVIEVRATYSATDAPVFEAEAVSKCDR